MGKVDGHSLLAFLRGTSVAEPRFFLRAARIFLSLFPLQKSPFSLFLSPFSLKRALFLFFKRKRAKMLG
jgi:hypothetical protein